MQSKLHLVRHPADRSLHIWIDKGLEIEDGLTLSLNLGACTLTVEKLLVKSLSHNTCKSSSFLQHVHQEESWHMYRGPGCMLLKAAL